jgi:hypothetical protein
MAMAVAANHPESPHPLTNYYFLMLSKRENYTPNKIGYDPVKMPSVVPRDGLIGNYHLRNYSGLEKKASEGKNHFGNIQYGVPIYSPLDSAVMPYERNKPKMYH